MIRVMEGTSDPPVPPHPMSLPALPRMRKKEEKKNAAVYYIDVEWIYFYEEEKECDQ